MKNSSSYDVKNELEKKNLEIIERKKNNDIQVNSENIYISFENFLNNIVLETSNDLMTMECIITNKSNLIELLYQMNESIKTNISILLKRRSTEIREQLKYEDYLSIEYIGEKRTNILNSMSELVSSIIQNEMNNMEISNVNERIKKYMSVGYKNKIINKLKDLMFIYDSILLNSLKENQVKLNKMADIIHK